MAETSSSAERFLTSAMASPERTTASLKAVCKAARVFSTATYSESERLMPSMICSRRSSTAVE